MSVFRKSAMFVENIPKMKAARDCRGVCGVQLRCRVGKKREQFICTLIARICNRIYQDRYTLPTRTFLGHARSELCRHSSRKTANNDFVWELFFLISKSKPRRTHSPISLLHSSKEWVREMGKTIPMHLSPINPFQGGGDLVNQTRGYQSKFVSSRVQNTYIDFVLGEAAATHKINIDLRKQKPIEVRKNKQKVFWLKITQRTLKTRICGDAVCLLIYERRAPPSSAHIHFC